MTKFKGFAKSVIGSREKNQDSFLVDDALSLYAVADGIGGGYNGEVASQMAMEGLKSRFTPSVMMSEIAKYLQKSIYMEAINQFGEALMGTTFTAIRPLMDEVAICHIGDSRLYHFDGAVLKQMTIDHEQYDDNMGGTVLCSYLGLDEKQFTLQIQEENFKVKAKDRLMLCSDGLYKQIEEPRIVELIKLHDANPVELLEKLTTEAAKAEHSDNITVVYIQVEE